jgi:hypothetical protein
MSRVLANLRIYFNQNQNYLHAGLEDGFLLRAFSNLWISYGHYPWCGLFSYLSIAENLEGLK